MAADIRPERPGDAAAISDLTTAAFKGTTHASGTEALIVERLRRAGVLTVSLVAVDAEAIIGHVACSPVTIGADSGSWYGLGPLSVRPASQRLGIGRRLIQAALQKLHSLGAAGCVLIGDPAYYGRFGFVSDPALTYRRSRTRYLQRLLLRGPPAAGDVSFHPSFDD